MSLTIPKPYQREGSLMIHRFGGRALLADDMGLGKTFQTLYYLLKAKKAPVIIVCPSVAKYVWEHEARKHVGMSSQILEGRKPVGKNKILGYGPLFIINYDILHHWIPLLRSIRPQVVVLDEAHYIKNPESNRFADVKELTEGIPHVIAISGTPLTNKPADLWATLNILLPEKFPSFMSFAMEYSVGSRERGRWVFKGGINLDKLHRRLKKLCMIRRRKSDVLSELSPKERNFVEVPVTDIREYENAAGNFLGWLRATSPGRVAGAQRNVALVRVGYLLRLVAKLKHKAVKQWIDNFLEESDGKLVVFTTHKPVIRSLEKRYGQLCVKVDGDTPKKQRKLAERTFQENPKCRLFLGNYKAAGVAITLTAASDLLCADFPWTPGDLTQAEDRIHRIGQKGTANIHYLIARGTFETTQCRALCEKQGIITEILDGTAKTADNFDLLSSVIQDIENTANRKKSK